MALSKFADKLKKFLTRYGLTGTQLAARIPVARRKGKVFIASLAELVKDELTDLPAITGFVTASVASTSLTVNWNAVSGATNYKLERSLDNTFTTGVTTVYNGTLLTKAETGLTADTDYWYRLTASATNKSDSVATLTVTTTA